MNDIEIYQNLQDIVDDIFMDSMNIFWDSVTDLVYELEVSEDLQGIIYDKIKEKLNN